MEVKENYKMLLFTAKQMIDRSDSAKVDKMKITRQLSSGKLIYITTENGEKYSSHIVTNLKDSICIETPLKNMGGILKLAKWAQVKVSVPEKGNKGYFFDSKVVGYSTMKGKSCILLQHSNNMTMSKERNFPRKELGKSCYFYKINIMTFGTGKDVVKKAVISDKKGRLGTVIEISAGGCSIKASNYLNKKDLVKIDIDIERKNTISILGKIVNLRKGDFGITIMHVQFTRMSKKHMNSINSYVYGIGEKTSILDYN
jgi:c-di-GMP-binding flagellar brake protein YcgR